MKYIQDENIFVLIGGTLFCVIAIWWIRSSEIKESKELEKENAEMDSITKMRNWRVYIIAGFGLMFFLFEIIKRLVKIIFL